MSDPEVYMVLKEDERSPVKKKRRGKVTKVVSIMVGAIIIIAALGYYLYFSVPDNSDEERANFTFAINTKWSTHFYSYIITFENRTETEDVKVVATNGVESKSLSGGDIQSINDHQFLVTPGLSHNPENIITIDVYKKGILMGTRMIKPATVDWDHTITGADHDYDFYYAVNKKTHDGTEKLTRNMEGILKVENIDNGIRANFTGDGLTRIETSSSDPDMEYNVEYSVFIDDYTSSVLARNDKQLLLYEMERGTGVGNISINIEGEEEITANLQVEEYLKEVIDNNLTDTRMNAKGDFSGTFTGTLQIETYKTDEEIHDNYAGVNYPCLVIEGTMKINAYEGPVPIYITSRQKTWNVKSLDFSYSAIYYEVNYTISGQSSGEESGYIEDAPQPANLTIADVITIKGIIPSELMVNDSFTLSSRYGYEVRYTAMEPSEENSPSADLFLQDLIIVEGEVTKGGNGEDYLILLLTEDNSFSQHERHFSFSWEDEFLSVNMTRPV